MDHALVARTAARQHGLVLRRQLIAAGLDPDGVDTAVRRRRLVRVAHGVYTVPGAPDTPQSRLMCAVLRCGPDAAAVGEAMLALVGIHTARVDAPATVLLRPGRRVSNVPWTTRNDRWDLGSARVFVHDVPSVGVARNLVEAAADVSRATLDVLVDGVRWLGRRHVTAAASWIARWGDHPGAAALRRSGLLASDAPESPPERRLVTILRHHRPRTQVWITPAIRVDVLIEEAGLVIEYDGEAAHAGPAEIERRRARDAAVRAAGYVIVHVTARDLADPESLVRRIDALVEVLAA